MARAFYTEYVNHCMKFYTRRSILCAITEADVLNWKACQKAIGEFSSDEQEILRFIYREKGAIVDNVNRISKDKNMNQDSVWKLITRLERKIAKIRGLI